MSGTGFVLPGDSTAMLMITAVTPLADAARASNALLRYNYVAHLG